MSFATAVSAVLGVQLTIKKKVDPLEAYRRTLELARLEHLKAAADLQEAARALVKTVEEKT